MRSVRPNPRAVPATFGAIPDRRPRLLFAAGALAGCLCTGCSFISMRVPPKPPAPFTAKAKTECRDVWYPIADSFSTFAGLTWVLHADKREEEEEGARQSGYTSVRNAPFDAVSPDVLRVSGYAVMALYGASSVYGFYVASQCANRDREQKENADMRRAVAQRETSRADPPRTVAGFPFRIPPEEATRICLAAHEEWEPQGSIAYCRPSDKSGGAPLARLEFDLGSLTRIAVLYNAPRESLNKAYDEHFARLHGQFGAPQIARAALSGTCRSALAECLESGETPAGARWFWDEGNIELRPVWLEEHAFIEERHTREAAVAP